MPEIRCDNDPQIGRIIIDNPGRRNALTFEMQSHFCRIVERIRAAPPRVLVIRGSGQEAFAAGGDLKELANFPTRAGGEQLITGMSKALIALTRLPTIVIGAINGDAAGGGLEILTACDLRIAAPQAHIHFAQIRLGLVTGWGGTGRLVHLIGTGHAARTQLLGASLTATEAAAIGFVHVVAPSIADFPQAVETIIDKLLSLPHQALALQKELLWYSYHQEDQVVQQAERDRFLALFGQHDHLEALKAFQEKRPPNFNQTADQNS